MGQGLLIGFRNPIPAGKALMVSLINPDKLITKGSADLGDPIVLYFGGMLMQPYHPSTSRMSIWMT